VGNKGLIGQTSRNNLPSHGIGQDDVGSDMHTQSGIRPLGRTGAPWINDIESRPTPDPLQHMMEKDRVCIARIRAPQHDQVGVFDLPIGAGTTSRPEYRRQTGDARRVSRPVTTVNIVAPHYHPGELLSHEIRLIARL
jgi:hypothetical protein